MYARAEPFVNIENESRVLQEIHEQHPTLPYLLAAAMRSLWLEVQIREKSIITRSHV